MSYTVLTDLFVCVLSVFFFQAEYGVCFKQKTAYEMRMSDWSSDVCSSDLITNDGAAIINAIDINAHSSIGCGIRAVLSVTANGHEIGRASCRERVCQYV